MGDKIHICTNCNFPISVYGRLVRACYSRYSLVHTFNGRYRYRSHPGSGFGLGGPRWREGV